MKSIQVVFSLFVLLAISAAFFLALNSTVALAALLLFAIAIFVMTIRAGGQRSRRIALEWDPKKRRAIEIKPLPLKATSSRMRTDT